jgi:hypothetical protein
VTSQAPHPETTTAVRALLTRAPVPPPPPAPASPDWHHQFPHRSYVELAAEPSAPPAARYRLRDDLTQWRLHIDPDDAQLVIAELTANAVDATNAATWHPARPPIRLWTIGGGSILYILTWDATILPPRVAAPGTADESGRGLQIIDALSEWGYYYPPGEQAGKVVWARLPKFPDRHDARTA